jgi:hypothetical protein
LEDLEVDGFAFLEDAELDTFLFLVIAGLPATVLVFSEVSLCTRWLDIIKAGSIRGPWGYDNEVSIVSYYRDKI